MSASVRWTLGIILLLGGSMAAVLTLVISSARTDGRQVLPDYDTRALHHEQVMSQHAKDRALGWSAKLELDGDELIVTLRDRAGELLRGATVEASMYHRAHASHVVAVRPTLSTDGTYQGSGGVLVPGIHQITGTARVGEQLFTFDGWAER